MEGRRGPGDTAGECRHLAPVRTHLGQLVCVGRLPVHVDEVAIGLGRVLLIQPERMLQ